MEKHNTAGAGKCHREMRTSNRAADILVESKTKEGFSADNSWSKAQGNKGPASRNVGTATPEEGPSAEALRDLQRTWNSTARSFFANVSAVLLQYLPSTTLSTISLTRQGLLCASQNVIHQDMTP